MVARLASPDDVDALVRVAAATFPDACPPTLDAAAVADHVARELSPTRFRTWLEEPAARVLVAELAPEEGPRAVVGYALLLRGVPRDNDVRGLVGDGVAVELSKFYALAAHRGTGLSATLMAATLDAARRLGPAEPLWLGTNGANRRAQAFYAKHGFTTAGPRTYVVGGQPQDDVVMVRHDATATA